MKRLIALFKRIINDNKSQKTAYYPVTRRESIFPTTFTKEFNIKYFKCLYTNCQELYFKDMNKLLTCPGIYIIINKNKYDKTYVGQTTNLCYRINQHFTDCIKSNEAIFNDYNNGNTFTIKFIVWNKSMPSLNQCEAALIRLLRTDSHYGYNNSLGRNNNDREVFKIGNRFKEY